MNPKLYHPQRQALVSPFQLRRPVTQVQHPLQRKPGLHRLNLEGPFRQNLVIKVLHPFLSMGVLRHTPCPPRRLIIHLPLFPQVLTSGMAIAPLRIIPSRQGPLWAQSLVLWRELSWVCSWFFTAVDVAEVGMITGKLNPEIFIEAVFLLSLVLWHPLAGR